jgi:hypothetical protein
LIKWPSKALPRQIPTEDYVSQLNDSLRLLIEVALQHQKKVIHRRLSKSPKELSKFEIGDYVLVSYPERSPDKLHTMWRGPLIVERVDSQTYYCRDLISHTITPFFIDRLKLFNVNPRVQPKEAALVDKDEFYVERIPAHTGIPKRKTDMLFKVRWLGYDKSEDTWEPWKNIKDLEALDTYILEHSELKKLKSSQ